MCSKTIHFQVATHLPSIHFCRLRKSNKVKILNIVQLMRINNKLLTICSIRSVFSGKNRSRVLSCFALK